MYVCDAPMTQSVKPPETVKLQVNVTGDTGSVVVHTNVAAIYAGQGTVYMDFGMLHGPTVHALMNTGAAGDNAVRVDVPSIVRLAMPYEAARQFVQSLNAQLQAIEKVAQQGAEQ